MEAEDASCLYKGYMNYPYCRHLQRYEYIVESGYVNDKEVVDLGCGVGFGTFMLSSRTKFVYGIDSVLDDGQRFGINGNAHIDRIFFTKGDLFEFEHHVDVCTLVEVFEHAEDPRKLISHISGICDYAFITTPLAKVTGRTINFDHIAEYSVEDFDRIVEENFEILDKVYQHGDMSITKEGKPCGDSFDHSHVVQMIWARSKNGKRIY